MHRDSRGSTFIEVLVVMSIVGVMFCLIVPALLAAKRTSNSTSCLNNLRNLGLALHNYDSSFNVFPPGVVDREGPIRQTPGPDDLHIGWLVQILPFMEQGSLALSFNSEISAYDPANATVARSPVKILACPEDGPSLLAGAAGQSNYAACYHDARADIDVDNHGVFFLNSRVGREDVLDGLSSTIFLGEKRNRPGDLGWVSGTWSTLRNTGQPINAIPTIPDEPGGPLPVHDGFESRHLGGAHFAFGDGSARFITQTIDPVVYSRLGHRADGEPTDETPK